MNEQEPNLQPVPLADLLANPESYELYTTYVLVPEGQEVYYLLNLTDDPVALGEALEALYMQYYAGNEIVELKEVDLRVGIGTFYIPREVEPKDRG